LAVNLSFMYSREWSQVQGTEKTFRLLNPVGPQYRFSVVFYVKMGKNYVMQGFCSWFSVAEVRAAVKFSFMYSREWSQVQGTEITS